MKVQLHRALLCAHITYYDKNDYEEPQVTVWIPNEGETRIDVTLGSSIEEAQTAEFAFQEVELGDDGIINAIDNNDETFRFKLVMTIPMTPDKFKIAEVANKLKP